MEELNLDQIAVMLDQQSFFWLPIMTHDHGNIILIGVFVEVRYNAVLRPSGGTADAAVSKTVVERRAGSNPASGTSYTQSLSLRGKLF